MGGEYKEVKVVAKSKGTMILVGNVKTKRSNKVDVLNT